jgi:hypothetical protein
MTGWLVNAAEVYIFPILPVLLLFDFKFYKIYFVWCVGTFSTGPMANKTSYFAFYNIFL